MHEKSRLISQMVADLHGLNCAEESLSCVTGPYTEQGKSLESKGSEITLKGARGS